MEDFDCKLGNFKCEVIDDEKNFKLVEYIHKNRLSRTRLYLLTKKKNLTTIVLEKLKKKGIMIYFLNYFCKIYRVGFCKNDFIY